MKKLALAVAAVTALTVGAAHAEGNFGPDANGTATFHAPVDLFCRLTQASGEGVVAGIRADTFQQSTLEQADGKVTLDIQDDSLTVALGDTVKADSAAIYMNQSICNTKFNVTLQSINGGLENDKFPDGSFGSPFVNNLDYTVSVSFGAGNNTAAASSLLSETTVISNQQPTFDDFHIEADVAADQNVRLLKGKYEDFVIFRIRPQY